MIGSPVGDKLVLQSLVSNADDDDDDDSCTHLKARGLVSCPALCLVMQRETCYSRGGGRKVVKMMLIQGGGVLATVGVVPPLCVILAGRGEDGGRELCLAINCIFFLRVERRERIIWTTENC